LLAIASGGGHWIELMRLKPAFAEFETVFVSMFDNYVADLHGQRFYTVPDASRFNLIALLPVLWKSVWILARERPSAVVTTGSAPMLVFILIARLLGIRTLWIDSIANSEHLSSSGRCAKLLAHRCIAQWENVAERERVEFWGRIV
jgi:UDP-N-acetylglucosamine:LPS N-acetylglucosamine transferase